MRVTEETVVEPLAHFRSPLVEKFGIPRQSGLVGSLPGRIVFRPAFRAVEALRGIEHFDYLWLLWLFSANAHADTRSVRTVRPPLLGGNRRMGVFATRSPFRPNNIGLSSVRLERVEWDTAEGPVIHVRGADLMDGTPIIDIKPYLAYADSHPGARSGFVDEVEWTRLQVVIPDALRSLLPSDEAAQLEELLALDPRPHYQHEPQKVYGMKFGPWNVRFRICGTVLTVEELTCGTVLTVEELTR